MESQRLFEKGVPGCNGAIWDGGKRQIWLKCVEIIESFYLERICNGHIVQLPFNVQGHLQLDQVAQSLTLSVSMNGTSTTSLGNLFQMFQIILFQRCWHSSFIYLAKLPSTNLVCRYVWSHSVENLKFYFLVKGLDGSLEAVSLLHSPPSLVTGELSVCCS